MANAERTGGGLPPHKASALAQMRTSYVLGTDGPDFRTTSSASFAAPPAATVSRVKRNMQESCPERYHSVATSATEVRAAVAGSGARTHQAPLQRFATENRSHFRPEASAASGQYARARPGVDRMSATKHQYSLGSGGATGAASSPRALLPSSGPSVTPHGCGCTDYHTTTASESRAAFAEGPPARANKERQDLPCGYDFVTGRDLTAAQQQSRVPRGPRASLDGMARSKPADPPHVRYDPITGLLQRAAPPPPVRDANRERPPLDSLAAVRPPSR